MRYHLTLTKVAIIIIKNQVVNVSNAEEKLDPSYVADGHVKRHSCFGNSSASKG